MVEVPPPPTTASWQKSSTSLGANECVQVIRSQGHVWILDSKNPLGPTLGFTPSGVGSVSRRGAARRVRPLRGAGLMTAPGRS